MHDSDIMENLLIFREWSDETLSQSQQSGQSMINSINVVSQLTIATHIPSEFYRFGTESIMIKVSKIAINMDYNKYCGNTNENNFIRISNEYVYSLSQSGEYNMDCIYITTSKNLYILSNNSINEYNINSISNSFQSNFISLEIKKETDYNLTSSNYDNFTELSLTDPFVLTFNLTNSSFYDAYGFDSCNNNHDNGEETSHFPLCSFYDENTQTFENDGCYLWKYNLHLETVQCFCLHLTYFVASWEEFEPEINFLSESEWRDVTLTNIANYPLGLIVVSIWIFWCLFIISLCQLNRKNKIKIEHKYCFYCNMALNKFQSINDKPLIAQSTKNLSKIMADEEIKLRYRSVQELRVLTDKFLKDTSLFNKFWHLFKSNIRNDHLWIGICARRYGTHYTHSQRIASLMVRLLSTFCVSALFFGRAKDTTIGDYSLSFYESILGFIPIFFIQTFIKRYKPGTDSQTAMKLAKQVNQDVEAVILSLVDTFVHKEKPQQQNNDVDTPNEATCAGINDVSTRDLFTILELSNEQIESCIVTKNVAQEAISTPGVDDVDETSTSCLLTPDTIRLEIMIQIQRKIYNRSYRYPHWCKKVSICCIVIWSIVCATITTIWCLWFDISLEMENKYEATTKEALSDNEYIELKTWINYNCTQSSIDDIITNWENNGNSLYNPPKSDSFSSGFGVESMDVSIRFLIAVMLSYFLSIFVWQPLVLAIKACLRLRMLHKRPNYVNEASLVLNPLLMDAISRTHEQTLTLTMKVVSSISNTNPSLNGDSITNTNGQTKSEIQLAGMIQMETKEQLANNLELGDGDDNDAPDNEEQMQMTVEGDVGEMIMTNKELETFSITQPVDTH